MFILNILISFFKLLQSVVLSIIFIPALHVTFEHNLIGNCKLYKTIFAFNS